MEWNQNIAKGKWNEFKGELQKTWGKLTDDEIDQTQGDLKSIGGLIQQKYGKAQEEYKDKLSSLLKRYEVQKDQVVDSIKDSLKKEQ